MFVRTKDGVYEVEQSQLEDDEEVVNCEYGQISKLEIERKSKKLEKLCDEFLGLVKSKSSDFIIMRVIAHSLKELKDSLKTELNGKTYYSKYDIIYGAIWTDKGLIYVAKMNSTGELELI